VWFTCLAGLDATGHYFATQDQIDELADVLQAGNGVEASAARVAGEELGAIREVGRHSNCPPNFILD
jgi:hypothetical protein